MPKKSNVDLSDLPESGRAKYIPHPELSPYMNSDRYENPKRDFVKLAEVMSSLVDFDNGSGALVDLGCANGELLYHLRKSMGSNWKLNGVDFVSTYFDVAKSIAELREVKFIEGDITKLEGKYDIITCAGTVPIFPNIEEVLDVWLEATNDGGFLFLYGEFNPLDVDVIVQYRDNSKPESAGEWRCDFNVHSQNRVSQYLDGKVKNFYFERVQMDIELPIVEGAPHMNIYTRRMEDGSLIKMHGGGQILDSHLLVIEK